MVVVVVGERGAPAQGRGLRLLWLLGLRLGLRVLLCRLQLRLRLLWLLDAGGGGMPGGGGGGGAMVRRRVGPAVAGQLSMGWMDECEGRVG